MAYEHTIYYSTGCGLWVCDHCMIAYEHTNGYCMVAYEHTNGHCMIAYEHTNGYCMIAYGWPMDIPYTIVLVVGVYDAPGI